MNLRQRRRPVAPVSPAFEEMLMILRFALGAAGLVIAMVVTMAVAATMASVPAFAEVPPVIAQAPQNAPATTAPSAEPFGEETTLTAKAVISTKGTGTWENAFQTITGAFKKLKAYADKEGVKIDGMPMTVFTSTDDTGFQYLAAMPIAEAPKNTPHGDIALGQSPDGRALKFIHHGSYDDLDNTYEAITNYLDEKRLEAKDVFIEEYVTDPLTADPKKLTVNVYVLLK
jgi:effector-binding domain-containing protein